MKEIIFPFTAITGQDNFKTALLLCLVDRSLGGVLAIGDKGTGKTTTVRALSQLMQQEENFPFINLPIGASEDRVLGSVQLEKLLNEQEQQLQEGLLSKAHKGILYVDEVNLLNDYLTDVMLDAAATGNYYLEREGLSRKIESRFCLVGTMNPEEGELRPQLLDRFGLHVTISTPQDTESRLQISKRRLAFDEDPQEFYNGFQNAEQALYNQISEARQNLFGITLPLKIQEHIAELCASHQVEGLRADILILKAARALAALNGKNTVSQEDVDHVAPFVLAHRSKSGAPPQSEQNNNGEDSSENQDGGNNPSGNGQQEQEQAENGQDEQEGLDQISGPSRSFSAGETTFSAQDSTASLSFQFPDQQDARKGTRSKKGNGTTKAFSGETSRQADVPSTVRHYLIHNEKKIHYKLQEKKQQMLLVFLVDSSGSMAKGQQIAFIKGILKNTLENNKATRLRMATIALQKGSAKIHTPATWSAKKILRNLETLSTGGNTPMTEGLKSVNDLIQNQRRSSGNRTSVYLYIFTDGRFNQALSQGKEPVNEAVTYYNKFLPKGIHTEIIDTESGRVRLGMAGKFAEQIGADYQRMPAQ